jgi:hypothetical protein
VAYLYRIVDGEKKTVYVPDELIGDALKDPSLAGSTVNLADKHGNIFSTTFDTETMRQAVQQGMRFETPEEYKFEQERLEYGNSPLDVIKAGAAAGLRAGTFSASDVALTGLGIATPEDLAAYQRQNPTADIVGEVGGALATGLAGVSKAAAKKGVGATVTGALRATPAGQMAKTALKSEAAITKALGGGRVAKAVGAGTAYGAEGAAYGLGHAISETTIHDRELISEATLADVGLGALLGGGAVVGLQQAGYGLTKLGRGAKKLMPEAKAGEPGWFARTIAKGDPENARTISELASSGESRALLKTHDDRMRFLVEKRTPEQVGDWVNDRTTQLIQEGIPEKQARAAAMAESKIESASLPELYGRLNDGFKPAAKFHAELKPEQARLWVQSGNEEELLIAARKILDDFDSRFTHMRGKPGEYAQPFLKEGQDRIQALKGKFDDIAERGGQHQNADIWYEIDRLKKDTGVWRQQSNSLKRQKVPVAARTDQFEQMYDITRKHLENPMHGRMAVEVQAPVNKAYSHFMNQLEAKIKTPLMRPGPAGPDWDRSVWVEDPGGFVPFVSNMGTPKGQLDTEHFLGLIRSKADLSKELRDAYKITGKAADDINLGIAAADAIERKIAEAERSYGLFRGVKRMGEPLSFDVKSAVRAGAPAAAGFMAGGPVGAAVGAAAGTLANPARMIQILSWADSKAGKAIQNMGKAVKGFVGRKAKVSKPAVSMVAAITGLSAKDKADTAKDLQAGYRKIHQQLASLQDKATLDRRVKTTALFMPPDMQDTMSMQSKRMVSHMMKHAPKANRQSRIDMLKNKPTTHDRMKIKRWFDRLAVASNPIETTMKAMNDGTLTGEMVDTLSELYPKLYNEMVIRVQEEIADPKKDISYADRIQLSLLMNTPMDQTMEPDFVARTQELFRQPQPAQEPGGEPMGAGKRINTGNLMQADAGKALLTGPQRLESKR